MTRKKILQNVEQICKDVFDNHEVVILEETTAEDIEEWDSFAHVNLILNLQNAFGVKFAFGELQDIKNVGELLTLIEEKIDED